MVLCLFNLKRLPQKIPSGTSKRRYTHAKIGMNSDAFLDFVLALLHVGVQLTSESFIIVPTCNDWSIKTYEIRSLSFTLIIKYGAT